MHRTRSERIALTEKKVVKRTRQLLDHDKALRKIDGEPWVRRNWLKDRSLIGRCGHRRCTCHISQRIDKNPNHLRDAEVIDYPDAA